MNLPKDIYVLGIRDGHSAGAAIIKNGEVLAAISEERLTNIKNCSGPPVLSIGKVFDIAGINPSHITLIAIASYIDITPDPKRLNASMIFRIHEILAPYLHSPTFIKWAIKVLHKLSPRTKLFEILYSLGLENKPHIFIEHHFSKNDTY